MNLASYAVQHDRRMTQGGLVADQVAWGLGAVRTNRLGRGLGRLRRPGRGGSGVIAAVGTQVDQGRPGRLDLGGAELLTFRSRTELARKDTRGQGFQGLV